MTLVLQSMDTAWEQRLFTLAQDALCLSGAKTPAAAKIEEAQVLRRASRACEAITARHSRSFYLATSLLPLEKRRAMRALYAFCRTADDLADGGIEQPEKKLDQLRTGLLSGRKTPGNPVLAAWADIQARYHIPICYAEQLIDGVECDLVQRRYSTFEDLAVYCYRVASTVGLMSMHITGFSSPAAIPYAIKLGVALQLTNILRDVGEDWSAGRLYLPLDELSAFGLDEWDVASRTMDDRWRAFMRFQIGRIRDLYREALPGIALLHPDGRFAVAAAACLYRGILNDIERHDFEVFARRAYVDRRGKLKALLEAYRYSQMIHLHPAGLESASYSQEGKYDF